MLRHQYRATLYLTHFLPAYIESLSVNECVSFFDKTVKSHGFLAKGLRKEGKISAFKFLALSFKETI